MFPSGSSAGVNLCTGKSPPNPGYPGWIGIKADVASNVFLKQWCVYCWFFVSAQGAAQTMAANNNINFVHIEPTNFYHEMTQRTTMANEANPVVERVCSYNILSSRLCDQKSFPENTESLESVPRHMLNCRVLRCVSYWRKTNLDTDWPITDELAAKFRLPRILAILEGEVSMNVIINLQEVGLLELQQQQQHTHTHTHTHIA